MNEKLRWVEASGINIACDKCGWTAFIAFGSVYVPLKEAIKRLDDHTAKCHPEVLREDFVHQLLSGG